MKCGNAGCEREATTGFAICIPPKGCAGRPIRVVPGIPVCEEHYAEQAGLVQEWLDMSNKLTGVTTREVVAGMCLARGLVEPDFADAFVRKVGLGSGEFRRVYGDEPPRDVDTRIDLPKGSSNV